MNFCLFIASSSARMDFCRPTNSGTTMCGKTMMSRSGRSGTRRPPCGDCGSRLSFRKSIEILSALRRASGGFGRLLIETDRVLAVGDDFLRDQHLFDVGLRRDVVHHVEHDVLHDGAETARTGLPLERLACDRAQRSVREAQVDSLHLEELLILARER